MSGSEAHKSLSLQAGTRRRHSIEDRRWNSFHGIVFQQPSQSRCSTSSAATTSAASEIDGPDGPSGRMARLSTYQDSSKTPADGTSLNLGPSPKLGYPNLSLLSSASSKDDLPFAAPYPASAISFEEVAETKDTGSISASQTSGADTPSVPHEPFRSPRGFHIPTDKFQNAHDSRPGSAASYWQYTLYQGPGGQKDKVKLHYCKNKEATEAVSQLFVNEEVIGFDIEWSAQAKSSDAIKKNVSLIQIACEERIALFHIARYPDAENSGDLVAPTFKRIMESPKITKVGVAIKGDCTRLKNFLGIHCQGLFELSYLHKLVEYCSGNIDKVDRRYVRLADQVQEHLKLPLLKGEVQTSDWGRDLDYQQTQYAASDSYAGLQLFHILEKRRQSFNPVPPRPAHAELNMAISLGDQLRPLGPVDCADGEDESSDPESISNSDIPVEELARGFFHVSIDNTAEIKTKHGKLPAPKPNETPSSRTTSIPWASHSSAACTTEELSTNVISSPELEIANQFASTFVPPPNRRIAPQALRAYSLWHEQHLSIPQIASILRRPPIQHRTVITYLCDAISIGNLRSEPREILRFASEYNYQPYIKIHKDLFQKARNEVWKA